MLAPEKGQKKIEGTSETLAPTMGHHPYGKEKAVTFKSALGITVNEAALLKEAIIKGLPGNDCFIREKDEYGERFTVLMKIRIFQKEAIVITGWIIRNEEDYPRLTSCYIKRRNK